MIGIIPCAGYGARLAPSVGGTPKPMLPIRGRPLIDYSLSIMSTLGASGIVLVVSSFTDRVRSYAGHSYQGLPIEYIVQDPPLGLLDAVCRTKEVVSDSFVTLLSDEIYLNCRHREMIDHWTSHSNLDGLVGYIAGSPWDDIRKNYSIVMEGSFIKTLQEKPVRPVNSLLGTGTWVLNNSFFEYGLHALRENPPERRSFVDALQMMVSDGRLIEGYDLTGKYINVNSVSDIALAETFVQDG